VALTTLSLSVIGLCIRAMNDMAENKRLLVSYLPRAQIEANAIVGVGTALVIICIGIIIVAVRLSSRLSGTDTY
jgi:CHASE3 domain sensor protein